MSARDPADVPTWPIWLGLVVEDLEAQRRFYREVLGLEEMDAGDDWVQFDLGERRIFELLRRDPDQIQYERARFQPGFEVGDIRRAGERLAALGARQLTEVEGGADHGGYWCYFADPEGHVFEITQSVPPASGPGGEP